MCDPLATKVRPLPSCEVVVKEASKLGELKARLFEALTKPGAAPAEETGRRNPLPAHLAVPPPDLDAAEMAPGRFGTSAASLRLFKRSGARPGGLLRDSRTVRQAMSGGFDDKEVRHPSAVANPIPTPQPIPNPNPKPGHSDLGQASHLTPRTSHLTPHTSHLTPHTSHLSPRTSHLAPHTSHLTPHPSPLAQVAIQLLSHSEQLSDDALLVRWQLVGLPASELSRPSTPPLAASAISRSGTLCAQATWPMNSLLDCAATSTGVERAHISIAKPPTVGSKIVTPQLLSALKYASARVQTFTCTCTCTPQLLSALKYASARACACACVCETLTPQLLTYLRTYVLTYLRTYILTYLRT